MRRLGADLVHGPDFAVPYIPRRPSVLTLHDLSPWMDPRWQHAADRVRHRTPLLLDLGVATMIVTPGDAVRKQAIEHFRLDPDRVVAIPEAPAPWFHRVDPPPGTAPYFLFVGTLEPRKNLLILVDAWREVRRHHAIDLVLAGRRRADAPAIAEEPGLRLTGEVPDDKLPELYSGALALVCPSLYEGFGLPVLEAMQCGTGVIASSAVAEAAGGAAVYATKCLSPAGIRPSRRNPILSRDRKGAVMANWYGVAAINGPDAVFPSAFIRVHRRPTKCSPGRS